MHIHIIKIHNSHMTIVTEHVNDYPLIRFEIRFERKFPIRRSLPSWLLT